MFFILFISLIVLQRLMELQVAKRNERWMKSKGAYEVGANHYPFMVMMHTAFFISIIAEVLLFEKTLSPIWIPLFVVFMLTQIIRIWCLYSLGRFWNTKIIILPGANVVQRGPYKFIRHPNYLIVCIEILVLPLVFQAYVTALLFTVLNLTILSVRIPIEERALREVTNYNDVFINENKKAGDIL